MCGKWSPSSPTIFYLETPYGLICYVGRLPVYIYINNSQNFFPGPILKKILPRERNQKINWLLTLFSPGSDGVFLTWIFGFGTSHDTVSYVVDRDAKSCKRRWCTKVITGVKTLVSWDLFFWCMPFLYLQNCGFGNILTKTQSKLAGFCISGILCMVFSPLFQGT